MIKKKALVFALAAMFAFPVFASPGEIENDDDYGNEHNELDDDLHTNLGMTVTTHADGHKEVEDGHGNHYSYTLQGEGTTNRGCQTGAVCYRDTGDGHGTMEVNYSSGKSELAHGESHNENELNEHANQMGYTVLSKTNGIVTVRSAATGDQHRVRYSAQMVRGAAGKPTGIRIENGRIVERYTDGWEQEIVPVN